MSKLRKGFIFGAVLIYTIVETQSFTINSQENEQVFSYIIGLGAAVMMPIIFTILGVCIGIKFSKALKSGLLVGVGFVGLSVVTALLTSSLGPALSKVVEKYMACN